MKKVEVYPLFLYLLLFSTPSFADVLFVDLNNSIGEIQTATAAATARGEKLIVVPSMEESKRVAIKQRQQEIERLSEISKNLSEKNSLSKSQNATLLAASDKIYELQIQVEKLLENAPPIEKEIQDAFDRARQNKQGFSSMIVSGHHSIHDENLGIIGNVTDDGFVKILDNNKDISSGIKSLYLWGCYTASRDRIYFWKRNLPSAQFVAGFEHTAPSDGKALNHDMLKTLMQKEASLYSNNDDKEVGRKIVAAISSINNLNMSSAALYLCGSYVDKSLKVIDVSDEKCDPNISHMMNLHYNAVVQSYLYGPEDVPEDSPTSPLRVIYTEGQEHKHCEGSEMTGFMAKYMKLLKLMKSKQINQNFFSYYREDLSKMEECVQAKTLPEDLGAPRASDSRPNILAWIDRVSKFAKDPKNANNQNLALVNKMSHRLQNIIKNLDCIQTDWIENYGPERLKGALDESCAQN